VRRLLPIGGRNLRVRLCQLGSVTLWPSPPWFLHSGSLHTLLFLVCVCVHRVRLSLFRQLTHLILCSYFGTGFFSYKYIYFSFLQYIGYLLFVFIKKNYFVRA
jgi:hypothetical protein